MAVKKGDIIDERKRHPNGCGLVVKVMGGGEGFQKIVCCQHELTEDDVIPALGPSKGRMKGHLPVGVILDEKKIFPDSCGLRVMIMDGGAGFKEIICCGHSITLDAIRDFQYGQVRKGPSIPGPQGNA